MSTPTKGTVYALLMAIGLLVLAITVLIWVDGRRVRRYADEIQDLHYRIDSQEVELRRLRRQPRSLTESPAKPDSAAKDSWE